MQIHAPSFRNAAILPRVVPGANKVAFEIGRDRHDGFRKLICKIAVLKAAQKTNYEDGMEITLPLTNPSSVTFAHINLR